MVIERAGYTPPYYEFAVKYAIVSYDKPKDKWDSAVKELEPEPIEIPTYQRSIVWRRQQVEDLLDSNSALFGTVILAKYQDRPLSLIDGLQRLATATALLFKLYGEVLSPTPANKTAAVHFKKLQALVGGRQPIVSHNDNMLKRHTRVALQDSYVALSENIEDIVTEELDSEPAQFAAKVQKMLLSKQIAIDPYFNFSDRGELTNTFITMNSTGIALSEVDLLRAELVEQAINMNWTPGPIQDMENKFTETFEMGPDKSDMKVLGKNIYDGLKDNYEHIFLDWSSLTPEHVDDLLDFINGAIEAGDTRNHPYLTEIFECGGLPFAITMMYFYKIHHMKGEEPDFLGGELNTNYQCRLLLRAFYRKLIDGTIGKIGPEALGLITGKITKVEDLSSRINPETFAGPLDSNPKMAWLTQRLRQTDLTRSKRIFNACMLPERTDASSSFTPLIFGKKQSHYAIDHLIPKATLIDASPGEHEINLLPNFAPLTNAVNSIAKAYPCERKIRPHEVYSTLSGKHPFIDWLVEEHYRNHEKDPPVRISGKTIHPLDAQSCLEPNATPPIGDDRIKKIAKILETRL